MDNRTHGPAREFSLRVRYVVPVDSPTLRDGVVTIAGAKIVEIGRQSRSADMTDLGNVALLPGLVNAHCHLDLSDLRQPLGNPRMPFAQWIEQVVAYRRGRDANVELAGRWRGAAVGRGLNESLASGVTLLGEIATSPCSDAIYAEAVAEAAVFLELIGLSAARQGQLLEAARTHLAARSTMPRLCGLSPHAPYTVRWELLEILCRQSARNRFPLAMHLAETAEERQFLLTAGGPLRELLAQLNAWDATAIPSGLAVLDYLHLLAQSHRVLVIHGNYLTAAEMDLLAIHRDRMAVVYCPRTHDYFGHVAYPLQEMLRRGVRVALGTDSRASNPDLDLLAEMRRVAELYPQLAPESVLRLGTLAGAEALGKAALCGSLKPGKRADFVLLKLPGETSGDLGEMLLHDVCPVARVYKGGKLAFAAKVP